LLLNGAALAELGQLDERYFLYAEETDWQLRAQRAGWTVAVLDSVTAQHAGAASSANDALRNELFHASGEKFARRWYGTLGWQVLRCGALFAAARRSLVGRRVHRQLNRDTFRLYLHGPATRESAAPSVVHVVRSDGFAGVERYIVDAATELAARGWRVGVIGGRPGVMRAELGADIDYEPARTAWQVYRALRAMGSADIVHAHMTAAELPAALLKRRAGARLIVTRHFATPRGRSAAGRLAAAVIERRMDMQLAISQFVADATSSPCIVLHNGARVSEQVAQRDRVVVTLQRLEPEKDTGTALRAWAASGLAARDWRLVVHGTGSAEPELRALATELGIEDTVTFAGFVDDPRTALRGAEVMLATARAEPFGLAVVEAMAEGTPVIATRAGAHPETLGQDGAYFAPGDVEGCAAQLVRLAESEVQRRALGDRLRERQRTMFSIAAHVDNLEALYREQARG
jgi:glycosyltransferase involved in cell wall biosynthesis